MATFDHRVAMARLNAEGHPRLRVQDIEATYAASKPNGVIRTAETLKHLTQDFPDYRFVWCMGADNFATFHSWGDADYIMQNFPIVVTPREGFTEAALNSPAANIMPRLDNPRDIKWANGWYLSRMSIISIAATIGRDELKQGHAPACVSPAVAHYALSHRVYSQPTI